MSIINKIKIGAEARDIGVAWSNVANHPTSMPASDVHDWAKANSKPTYTWNEIADKPTEFTPSSHVHDDKYLSLGGGTVTGDTTFNKYLKINAWPGYGTGSANSWYNGNDKYLEIQNATNLKLSGVNVWKVGDAVTGAVWNDLIDCIDIPKDDIIESGYCYCMYEDGHYHKSEKYLDNRFIGIDSDTYSLAMNMEPEKRKLNAAVSGFVLAYVDKEYPIGTALTCTENGYLTEIKKEDKCYNPERIIATYWKSEEREEIIKEDRTIKVNGRKWVKIK